MKRLVMAVFGALLFTGTAFAQDIDLHNKYTPTKSDWLAVQLTQAYDMITVKDKKIGSIDFMVGDRYVDVYINCDNKLSSKRQAALEEEIRNVSKKIFEKYDWSRHVEVRVELSSCQKSEKGQNK